MNMYQMEEEARKIVGKDDWHAWEFQRAENGILVTGACCPLITKGPNKGMPNYRKADPKTKTTVIIGLP